MGKRWRAEVQRRRWFFVAVARPKDSDRQDDRIQSKIFCHIVIILNLQPLAQIQHNKPNHSDPQADSRHHLCHHFSALDPANVHKDVCLESSGMSRSRCSTDPYFPSSTSCSLSWTSRMLPSSALAFSFTFASTSSGACRRALWGSGCAFLGAADSTPWRKARLGWTPSFLTSYSCSFHRSESSNSASAHSPHTTGTQTSTRWSACNSTTWSFTLFSIRRASFLLRWSSAQGCRWSICWWPVIRNPPTCKKSTGSAGIKWRTFRRDCLLGIPI